MKYDWILEVIADLEGFATANDLRVLASELSHLKYVAAADIACKEAQEGQGEPHHPARKRPH